MTEGEERLVEGDGHVGQKAMDSAKSFGGECNCLDPCIAVHDQGKKDVLHLHSLFITTLPQFFFFSES